MWKIFTYIQRAVPCAGDITYVNIWGDIHTITKKKKILSLRLLLYYEAVFQQMPQPHFAELISLQNIPRYNNKYLSYLEGLKNL